jgi:tetratricopeptide (TPR) repeat protein
MAPDAADPRASYADLLFFSGRYEEALTQYRKSLEIKPDYWYSFQRIGNIYTLLGRLREAEAEHLKAQEVLPVASRAKGGARMVHAMMDMYRGSYADAEQQYLHVLRDDSTAWEAAIGLCTALIRLGKFGEAEQVLNRIYDGYRRRGLESSSSIAGYHLVRAKYLTAKGELDSALVACSRAVVVAEPRARAGVYGQYAEIYLRQRSFEAALEACDVALRENPNYPPALLMLARVYHARGDTPMTEEICGRLLTLWKDADGDFRDLKEVRSLLGSRQMPA